MLFFNTLLQHILSLSNECTLTLFHYFNIKRALCFSPILTFVIGTCRTMSVKLLKPDSRTKPSGGLPEITLNLKYRNKT